MKKIAILLTTLSLFYAIPSNAQIWDKIKKRAEEKAEELLTKKRDKKSKKEKSEAGGILSDEDYSGGVNTAPVEVWRNYKFVPGEDVIFYDDLKYEEVGEFPSRWDLRQGGAEIATFDGDKVIIGTAKYENTILPLFNNKKYLSDEFTIEFDIYVDEMSKSYNNNWTNYDIILSSNSLNNPNIDFTLRSDKTTGQVGSYDFQLENVKLGRLKAWHHIAMSYNKGKFKMYYDEKRIANLPRLNFTPNTFGIQMDIKQNSSFPGKALYGIRNIRIANGGGQLYKRIISEGKYSTNGIHFKSGEADVESQSLGIINKIAAIMKENKDWDFQIIGHTDSDGDNTKNLSLSQKRAEAVKKALVEQGIKKDRITCIGKGETELLFADANASIEDKANNRRVEFLKQ